MAKVTAPLHSAEARGRVGGLVYNTWRGLATVKAKSAPAQPRSQKQLAIRSIAITLARRWQTILQSVRDAWNAYAATHTSVDWTGNPVRLTGLNWYLAINTRQLHASNAQAANPPSIPAPPAVVNFNAANGAGTSVLTWTTPADDDYNVTIYLQGPHSPGAIGSIPKAKFRVNANANAATVTLLDLAPGFYSIWARMYDTVTGLVSGWVLDSFTIT